MTVRQLIEFTLWLCSKDAKLLKTLKFPKEYDLKVDLKKVNWEVMKGWVAKRITELLGLEDEVVIGYVLEQLENKEVKFEHHALKAEGMWLLIKCVPQKLMQTCMLSRDSIQSNCKSI